MTIFPYHESHLHSLLNLILHDTEWSTIWTYLIYSTFKLIY